MRLLQSYTDRRLMNANIAARFRQVFESNLDKVCLLRPGLGIGPTEIYFLPWASTRTH
ncbi:MAG: hypothetical protein CM1200mP24_02950 [Gammaproteobacteria bacterium]|nr:MAG: hypothetical protein CM1200mP24_02950 [Gammaproteobacteria bacterium]